MATFDPINTALLIVITILLGWYLKDRFAAVDKRFDAVDKRFDGIDRRLDAHEELFEQNRREHAEMKADIAALKALVAALQVRLEEVSREVVGMRSDLTQIALAVGARTRPETA